MSEKEVQPITEGKMSKGGLNHVNLDSPRPPAPGGSGGNTTSKSAAIAQQQLDASMEKKRYVVRFYRLDIEHDPTEFLRCENVISFVQQDQATVSVEDGAGLSVVRNWDWFRVELQKEVA